MVKRGMNIEDALLHASRTSSEQTRISDDKDKEKGGKKDKGKEKEKKEKRKSAVGMSVAGRV